MMRSRYSPVGAAFSYAITLLRTTSIAVAASGTGSRPPRKSGTTVTGLSMLSSQSSVVNWRNDENSKPFLVGGERRARLARQRPPIDVPEVVRGIAQERHVGGAGGIQFQNAARRKFADRGGVGPAPENWS